MVKKPSKQPAERRSAPAKTPTLADIAAEVGVTKITVSRALNNPGQLSPATLEKVRAAIRRSGYTPNLLAGSLSSNRSKLVVALVPSISGAMFTATMQNVAEHLQQHGYQLLIGQAGYDDAREDALLEAVIGRRPDGIILTGIVHSAQARQKLRAARIPVVETWDLTPKPIDMLVGFSHPAIGRAAAEYLWKRGCRRPAIISPDDRRARLRAEAFSAVYAAKKYSVPVIEAPAPTPMGDGRSGLAALLAKHPGIDGVFCGSDNLALGALIEAKARDIAVPQQLRVIGYGDQSYGKDADPPLTSVRIDGAAIGRLAAEMLVARATGQAPRKKIVDIGFSIAERASA
ncbi:MAG: LacI family DNA-binding transcriptional regulator [Ferrovibrio sp.]|uniref:LacI family DNA-binding transcriptional regulator n=1 Tax=Ferrovibrio sp. TaxID=1917215 RepID=UPI0026229DA1|nr:LacI family DNA-binding transcriptional regulator [Ferrovibrio sp.]MCW0233270.1 LacI family DNA-binding transcriptional regulator [Ferrovibrio sp.]